MFNDSGFDEAHRLCKTLADTMRRHGPFESHRLPMEELEYTTLPRVMDKLGDRWEEISE